MFNRHTRTQEKRTVTGDSFELRPQTTAESSTHHVDRHIDDALKAIQLLSATAIDLASYAGVPGLEIALSSLSGLVKMVIKARDNDTLVNQIVGQVQAIVRLIEETVNSLMAHTETYQNGGDSTDYKAMPAHKLRQSHRLAKIFRSEQNAQLLNKIQCSIAEARSNFQTGCLVRIEFGMSSLQGDMTRIRGELVAGNEMLLTDCQQDEELLSRLLHIDHAEYRSAINSNKNGYLSGTRTGLLAQLKHWAQDVSDQPPIFILSGAAGTGKSTVAYELAKELDEEGHLGASFFFVRGDAALSSTEHVFPSIAYQLARTQPDFHSLIVEACRSHLARGGLQDIELQLRELIVNPLKTISVPRHPVVIIIDALDECTASASDRIPRMLYVLLKGIRELQTPLRILLTTRPEMHIDKVFASIEFRGTAKPFRMQDIPLVDADNDIRHYFAINLNKFSDVDHLLIARPNLIQSLVDHAEGLFIYATTIIRILQNDPRHLLELVDSLLNDPDLQTPETLRLVELDRLYLKALEAAFPSDFLFVRKENRRLVNSVLGTTAILEDQISPTTIKALLGIPINDTRSVLDRIGAVVYSDSDDDDEPIRPIHASFPQFLIDSERCPNPDFFVDPPLHNGQLASACLRLLNRDPDFSRNILRMDEPFTPKEHINDFHDRVHRYIPPHLRYAVKHWATHLHYASKEPELAGLVQSFAESKLLVWLEALSMLNELRSAIVSLDYARAWCQVGIKP
ncbi:hypothetical protein WOLCODRAFT_108014 [Wolfiporia cocos MD-104 SS10]|uniref:NACHT domain-containing protein n=1 Tax=Wolfiporia cocos (strain MD-104) TaxID=742152 RepID=A0A2H3J888_WOLCO|nr:hypothetical protein WOLCODRAFT_108014 [Wolfiporia cocos MD-104 SS10]